MTDRPTASTITDAQLDELYRRIDTLEHVAAGNKRHVQLIVPELERAEAAIARAREVLAFAEQVVASVGPGPASAVQAVADRLRAALDGPGPEETDTTQAEFPGHPCPCCGLRIQAAEEPDDAGLSRPEPCEDCLAGVHGPNHHRKHLPDTPDTITDPAWLREQYEAAIRAVWDGWLGAWASTDIPDPEGTLADAVMRVRDRHVTQLRQRLQLAAKALADEQRLYRLRTAQWQRACTDRQDAEQRADQLAAAIAQVRRFNEMVAHASCRVQAAEHARDTLQILDAALNPQEQP